MDARPAVPTDEELAASIAADGDETACAELFARYRRKVYLWCHGYTHDRDEAVDCTQEIFVKIFRHLEDFAGRSRFSTWVYRITRNHCLGLLSQRSREWRRRLVQVDEVELADPDCEDFVRRADLDRLLTGLLDRARDWMKEEELQAFVLHYRDGMTVKEITRVLACENTTGARTLIQNARRKFRRMVERREYPGG